MITGTDRTAEYYWQMALQNGGERDLKKDRSFTGQKGIFFERMGQLKLAGVHAGQSKVITTPRDSQEMEGFMTKDEIKKWRVSFPDALVLEYKNPEDRSSLELVEIADFKVVNLAMDYDRLVDQLRGFANFVDYLRHGNSARGVKVVRHILPWIQRLTVPVEVQYHYITPQGDDVSELPSTLDGVINIRHSQVPMTSKELTQRVTDYRLRNGINT